MDDKVASDANATKPPVLHRGSKSSNSRRDLIERGITCHPLAGNGLRIEFAARRDKSSALLITMVGLMLMSAAMGVAMAVAALHWHTIFGMFDLPDAAIFLFINTMVFAVAIYFWFVSKQVTVQYGTLISESRALLFRRRKAFSVGDISDIYHKLDSSSSTTYRGNVKKKVTYGLMLKMHDGRSFWIAHGIFQEEVAMRLVDEIKNALGMMNGAG